MSVFSLSDGHALMRQRGERFKIYSAIVLGIALHFVWEILTAAVRANTNPQFGSWGLIAARLGIALIVGVVSFVGIYKQLDGADPAIRFFLAATQGFAIDALTNPIGPATTN